jgi:hypothetical protein
VEALFAHTYLLLFGKIAVGGLLSLAVPPFLELERGFFRSTGAVYLAVGAMMAAGVAYLAQHDPPSASGIETASWILFVVLFGAYYATLFVELPFMRARLFPLAVFAGFWAVATTAMTYVPPSVNALAGVAFVVASLAGAAVVGSGVSGMLLGHWYLIESDLDLTPLTRMLAYCRYCLAAEVIAVALAGTLLWAWPGSAWDQGFANATSLRFAPLIAGRVACWALAALLLDLIRRTLAIPQTMAATGLFYIEALVVTVGQIVAHWLLFRTGLPL